MKKDQYILAVTGILDRESADLLLRELSALVRTGYRRIALGARNLGPVLPEGVFELRRGIAELLQDVAADPAPGRPALDPIYIECVDLSEHASAQFLLNAVPVENRRALLSPPGGEDFAESDAEAAQTPAVAQLGASGWLVDCPNCRHASRVRAAGDYACPVCGSAFRMESSGEVVTV